MPCNGTIDIFLIGLMSSIKTDIRTTNEAEQPMVTFAYVFPILLMVVLALLSNGLSIDTFHQAQIRLTTTGHYLLIYSYLSTSVLFLLAIRLIQLSDSLNHAAFMSICNAITPISSILTRICLWLNGMIAFHRALLSLEFGDVWNRIQSRVEATKHIIIIIICVALMHVPELIVRRTLPDPVAPGKFVCQIKYPESLSTLNTVFSFLHLLVPVSLNMLANCLILSSISRRKANLHNKTRRSQWLKEFRRIAHLFVSPTLTTICILPQLILSLEFSCVDISIKSLLRLNTAAALIIHLPQAATFLLFIFSSKAYMKIFKTQSVVGRYLCHKQKRRNTITPLPLTICP